MINHLPSGRKGGLSALITYCATNHVGRPTLEELEREVAAKAPKGTSCDDISAAVRHYAKAHPVCIRETGRML